MSADAPAGGDEDPGRAGFIRMPASETFDGRERVMTREAYDLQVLATAHSAYCGHPGFVPDDYLEHLDGLHIETTITAAELCAIGMWQRTGGGYRVLDWEAVEICLDSVRLRNGEDPRALAWDADHEARFRASMPAPIVVTPPCAACGTPSARIELTAPGHLPAGWEQWPAAVQASIARERQPGQWYLLAAGPAAGNGYGHPVSAARAGQITWAFRSPLRYAQVRAAGLYDDAGFCGHCDAPYCRRHWHLSGPGYGRCPRGHGKSLDPQCSP
jgi:hypothetical protein